MLAVTQNYKIFVKLNQLYIEISQEVSKKIIEIKVTRLIKKNKRLNYQLIRYVWDKNYQITSNINHLRIKSDELDLDSLYGIIASQSENNIDLSILFERIASELKNDPVLKNKLNILLDKITMQPKKKYAYESLKILYVYGTLHHKYMDGSYQQESVIDFVEKNLAIILSQGRLKKTKPTKKQQANELIKQNKETLDQLEEKKRCYQLKDNTKMRRTISQEIESYIHDIHHKEQEEQIQQTQQKVDEVKGIMLDNIEKIIERDEKLNVLDEKAESLQERSEEFFKNTSKVNRKTAKDKTLFLCYVLVAFIITTALIYCICVIFNGKLPSQSLDNVTLTQGIKDFLLCDY